MEITPRMLRDTAEAAIVNVRDKAKTPHETDQEFLGRCWYEAFERTVNKYGFKVATIDPSTGAAVICKFTEPSR